jgi:hypothetical protein
MSEFINTIDVLGDDAVTDALLEGTLTEFKDNVISSLAYCSFSHCKSLHLLDVPNVTLIKAYALGVTATNCCNITQLILRGSTVCSLASTNAFKGTPISKGTGYIYVPRALIDSYKNATNWSTFVNQFRALEDYTVDGTITGELDESKI